MIHYRFRVNVECQLSLLGQSYQKTLAFTKTWRYNVKVVVLPCLA